MRPGPGTFDAGLSPSVAQLYLAQSDNAGANGQIASGGYQVTRVECRFHNDLLGLCCVGRDGARTG